MAEAVKNISRCCEEGSKLTWAAIAALSFLWCGAGPELALQAESRFMLVYRDVFPVEEQGQDDREVAMRSSWLWRTGMGERLPGAADDLCSFGVRYHQI